jgi:type IV secretory pathway TrbD component
MTNGSRAADTGFGAGFGERALRAMMRAPEDLAYPLATDLAARPLTVDVIAPQGLTPVQKVAGAVFVLLPVCFLVFAVIDASIVLFAIAAFIAALAGLMFWLIGKRAAMAWRITWMEQSVEVLDQRWNRNHRWSAPYCEFSGVAVRSSRLPGYRSGTHSAGRPIHVAELIHENPAKTLLLQSVEPSEDAERAARETAGHLAVPFLARQD